MGRRRSKRMPSPKARTRVRAVDEFRLVLRDLRTRRGLVREVFARAVDRETGLLDWSRLPKGHPAMEDMFDLATRLDSAVLKATEVESKVRESLQRMRDHDARSLEDADLRELIERSAENMGFVRLTDLRDQMRSSLTAEGFQPVFVDALLDRHLPARPEVATPIRRRVIAMYDRDIAEVREELDALADEMDEIGVGQN